MKKTKKNITAKDISEALNVSASTVSRALKNSPEISQKTKELVWTKAKEMGYFPSIPVYMQKQKSRLILFLTDSLNSVYQQEIMASAQEYLTEKDYFPLIRFIAPSFKPDETFYKQLSEIDLIGVIGIMKNRTNTLEICKKFKEINLPLVSAGNYISDLADVTVLPDINNGYYLAASHLLKRGARNLLLITDQTTSSFSDEIENGISTALANHPDTDFKKLICHPDLKIMKQEFDLFLKNHPKTDGIITNSAETAGKVYNYLSSKNLKIPDDIMLVSFGNETHKDLVPLKISAVEFSSFNLGLHAAQEIDRIIQKKEPESRIIIEPVKLIIRSSSMKVN